MSEAPVDGRPRTPRRAAPAAVAADRLAKLPVRLPMPEMRGLLPFATAWTWLALFGSVLREDFDERTATWTSSWNSSRGTTRRGSDIRDLQDELGGDDRAGRRTCTRPSGLNRYIRPRADLEGPPGSVYDSGLIRPAEVSP